MCYKFAVLAFICVSGVAAQNYGNLRDAPANVQEGSQFLQDVYVAMKTPNGIEFGQAIGTPQQWKQCFETINLGDQYQQSGGYNPYMPQYSPYIIPVGGQQPQYGSYPPGSYRAAQDAVGGLLNALPVGDVLNKLPLDDVLNTLPVDDVLNGVVGGDAGGDQEE